MNRLTFKKSTNIWKSFLSEELNEKVFEHVMAGIEIISGKMGHHSQYVRITSFSFFKIKDQPVAFCMRSSPVFINKKLIYQFLFNKKLLLPAFSCFAGKDLPVWPKVHEEVVLHPQLWEKDAKDVRKDAYIRSLFYTLFNKKNINIDSEQVHGTGRGKQNLCVICTYLWIN